MPGILFSQHKSPTFEFPNSMCDVTGIEHGCIAQFSLAQLTVNGQHRQTAILVSAYPNLRKAIAEGLMRSRRG